jgi:hypothetical protein
MTPTTGSSFLRAPGQTTAHFWLRDVTLQGTYDLALGAYEAINTLNLRFRPRIPRDREAALHYRVALDPADEQEIERALGQISPAITALERDRGRV